MKLQLHENWLENHKHKYVTNIRVEPDLENFISL